MHCSIQVNVLPPFGLKLTEFHIVTSILSETPKANNSAV